MTDRIYIPRDSTALSLGADDVAQSPLNGRPHDAASYRART